MGKREALPDCTCTKPPRTSGIRCLTCAPLTDMELHRLERARETGKVKPPTWWRPCKLPTKPVVDLRQKYPPQVLAMFTRQSDPFLDRKIPEPYPGTPGIMEPCDMKSTADYVKHYIRINNLTA